MAIPRNAVFTCWRTSGWSLSDRLLRCVCIAGATDNKLIAIGLMSHKYGLCDSLGFHLRFLLDSWPPKRELGPQFSMIWRKPRKNENYHNTFRSKALIWSFLEVVYIGRMDSVVAKIISKCLATLIYK